MRLEVFGPLAAGKTTLATFVASHLGIPAVLEHLPSRLYLQAWMRGATDDAWAVQTEFYTMWLRDALRPLPPTAGPLSGSRILDHSLVGHHEIYTAVLRRSGAIGAQEAGVLDQLYDCLQRKAGPAILIYLDVPPKEIMNRIGGRQSRRDAALHHGQVEAYCRLAAAWAEAHRDDVLPCREPDDFSIDDDRTLVTPAWLGALAARLATDTRVRP